MVFSSLKHFCFVILGSGCCRDLRVGFFFLRSEVVKPAVLSALSCWPCSARVVFVVLGATGWDLGLEEGALRVPS